MLVTNKMRRYNEFLSCELVIKLVSCSFRINLNRSTFAVKCKKGIHSSIHQLLYFPSTLIFRYFDQDGHYVWQRVDKEDAWEEELRDMAKQKGKVRLNLSFWRLYLFNTVFDFTECVGEEEKDCI